MPKESLALKYANPNFELSHNVKELEQQVLTMSRLADNRLRALEVARHDKHFESVLSYSYKSAIKSIQGFSDAKLDKYGHATGKRFTTKIDTTSEGAYQRLMARANALRDFINKPTSTKTGIRNTYIKRVNTWNKNYGTDFTWETFANFIENGGADALKKYDSATVVEIIANVQQTNKEKIKKIKDFNERVKVVAENKEQQVIIDALLEDGLDFNNLHK